MAGIFVRLKLTLLRNGLRRGAGRATAFVITVLCGVTAALAIAADLLRHRGAEQTPELSVLVFTGLVLSWVVVPPFFGSGDESADPSRLVTLPLRPRDHVVGSAAAALVGPGPLITLIVAGGGAFAVVRGGVAVAFAVLSVHLLMLLCVVASRGVLAAYVRGLTGRRGNDVAAFGGVAASLGLFAAYLLVLSNGVPGLAVPSLIPDLLRWLPPGWIADAPHAAAEGRFGPALAESAGAAAVIGLMLRWWEASVARLAVTTDVSTTRAVTTRHPAAGHRFTRHRTLLITRCQLHFFLRAPRHRATVVFALSCCALLSALLATMGVPDPYVPVGGAWIFGLFSSTLLFSIEGSAIWLNFAALRTVADARAELHGRVIAHALVATPLLTVITLAGGLMGDRPGHIPAALGLSLAMLLVMLVCGMVVSVRWPYALEHDSITAGIPGQNSPYYLAQFVAGCAGPLIVAPPAAIAAVVPPWITLPLSVAYGLVVLWVGLRLTGDRLHRTHPEVLQALRLG